MPTDLFLALPSYTVSQHVQARCRNQGVVLDVPLEPVVQENEVMHTSGDAGTRKVGPKVMAEKVAGSGVFFRAFVKGSKSDRVLLYFPEDTGVCFGVLNMLSQSHYHASIHSELLYTVDPCILEWVYKVSSRIYRANASAKSTWKYQGNGAWKLTEKSKKKPKSCKRSKAALNQPAGTASAICAGVFGSLPESVWVSYFCTSRSCGCHESQCVSQYS